MPTFGTFNARIEVDGKDLTEYDVRIDEQEKKVSCWIPSETGRNFSVAWYSLAPTLDTAGMVILDGVKVGGRLALRGDHAKVVCACTYTSPTTARYFSFSPITYTDDDSYLNAPANFGEIQLTIWRVQTGEATFRTQTADPVTSQFAKVHERSKKLGAHRVQFSEVQLAPPTTSRTTNFLETLATFVFRYRPIDMLQANGIAPPPPRTHAQQTAESSTSKRKASSEDSEEVLIIKDEVVSDSKNARRIKALKKELHTLETHRNKKRNVKIEKTNCPVIDNEVIDLT